jgi:GTP-binding protein HflX
MKERTVSTMAHEQERAVLVNVVPSDEKDEMAQYTLQELTQLAETAGVVVLETVTQRKDRPDPKWFIGQGKLAEIHSRVSELQATTVIFNQELSGGQVRNLEASLDKKIIDRTQLILDIFAQRANTKEGILQVELAQLSYLLPRLSGQGKNLSRLGGGIGTRGPGETKLETDRRHIRNRIADLRRQCDEVKRHRKLHRERRKKNGIFQAALVGYTNAGKSTLLNQLTQSNVMAEDKLFATLDPTSRSLLLPSGAEVIVTDTVGFIRQLPLDLVAAFRATLEEVLEADLIIHVVDASASMRDEMMRVVDEVLYELGAHAKDRITLFNKIDRCKLEERTFLPSGPNDLQVSAFQPNDLELFKHELDKRVMGEMLTLQIPVIHGEFISLAYRVGEVISSSFAEETMVLQVKINRSAYQQWGSPLKAFLLDQKKSMDRGESSSDL